MLCRLRVLGGIKVGCKKLFIRNDTGAYQEIEPICVLDFYVHEDHQRLGVGKRLYEVADPSKLWHAILLECRLSTAALIY